MSRFARGKFVPTRPAKYVGNKSPTYRSSWEWAFMKFCDNNDNILKWASEAVQIPYRDPLTNRNTVYIPDFFIQYIDKDGRMLTELIEVKPANQTLLEKVGRNKNNQMQYVKNQAKWQAAQAWCKSQGIKFRVLNETDLFANGTRKR
jgi:hypothetical protein